MKQFEHYSLQAYNSFGLDVEARYFVEYESVADIQELLQSGLLNGKRVLAMGGGSNLLFLDQFNGVVLHSGIVGIEEKEHDADFVTLRIGSGTEWDAVCAYAAAHNLGGIENLSGIPGETGAAAVQNIGAYGVEIKDVITAVETIALENGKQCYFTNANCNYGYRDSIFKQSEKGKHLVTAIEIKLCCKPVINREYGALNDYLCNKGHCEIADLREAVIAIRNTKLPDPKKLGNAGSFFKNPVIPLKEFEVLRNEYPTMPSYSVGSEWMKIPAAWLIEQSGWKGKNLGNAGVYEKQPLVLVNRGVRSGKEIAALANAVIKSVEEKFGIALEPEVNFI